MTLPLFLGLCLNLLCTIFISVLLQQNSERWTEMKPGKESLRADCIEAITDWIIDIEDIKKLGLPRCLEFDLEEVYKRTKVIKEEKYTAQCNIS